MKSPKGQGPPRRSQSGPLKNQQMVLRSTDGQSAGGHGEEDHSTGEKNIENRKDHASGRVRF